MQLPESAGPAATPVEELIHDGELPRARGVAVTQENPYNAAEITELSARGLPE
jgi:hypothetical protein